MYNSHLNREFNKAVKLADAIDINREQIINILIQYETYEAACDEINRSIRTLRGLEEELKQLKYKHKNLYISTFFPLNLPLYSLVLFGIVPSIFSRHVFIRPPEVMQSLLVELINCLGLINNYPNISVHPTPRHIFIDIYAKESDVIIFTGKYQNAIKIHEQCPQSVLMYNGSGINPIVIFENADLDLAAEKAVEMRCFNSGQDCAGPDILLVPNKLLAQFNNKLESLLKVTKVGATSDKNVRIGPIMKESYVQDVLVWLDENKDNIIYGGEVNLRQRIVYPTIISNKLSKSREKNFHEFFAPVFYVLGYEDDQELTELIKEDRFNRRGMYASVFGTSESVELALSKYCRILKNRIVNDVEIGNTEYGGYGRESNFVISGKDTIVSPLLISRDLHKYLPNSQLKRVRATQ